MNEQELLKLLEEVQSRLEKLLEERTDRYTSESGQIQEQYIPESEYYREKIHETVDHIAQTRFTLGGSGVACPACDGTGRALN